MRTLACAIAIGCVLVAPIAAHPVATTTVAVAVDTGGRVVATITADANPLIAKLEALSFDPLPNQRATTPAERAARLDALRSTLLAHVSLMFDGRAATLVAEPANVSDAGQATIRLAGFAPASARTLTWSSSLVYGSYPVAVRTADGREGVQWLQAQETTEPVALAGADRTRAIGRGLWLGFTHIVPNGIDHILFVLGLFLLGTKPGQLLAQVSAFTLAHSITLALSLYGVFSLPPRIVEPMIALSVAYVGVENLITSRLHPWRVAIVFGFGLLHGLGFAEALASLHLSRPEMLSTLISFNAGVEGGQLTVIAIAAAAMGLAARLHAGWRRPVTAFSSGAIGLVGLFWTIQRLW
ncbi:MAG TPA: HupE/UreJ family protein [Vicinamibacterales bacterium]|nr:HupE/UreJ family protein [Vicinamibacterales bacterium]